MFHRHLWQSRDLINMCSKVSEAHDTYHHRVKKVCILYFVVICICDKNHTGNVAHESVNRAYALRMCRGSTVDEHCDNEGHSLPHYSSTSHASLRTPVQQLFAELSLTPLTNSWQRQLQVNRSTVPLVSSEVDVILINMSYILRRDWNKW